MYKKINSHVVRAGHISCYVQIYSGVANVCFEHLISLREHERNTKIINDKV